jgi:hypothetical protein
MKAIYKYLVMVALIVATGMMMTACGGDDDDNGGNKAPTNVMTYNGKQYEITTAMQEVLSQKSDLSTFVVVFGAGSVTYNTSKKNFEGSGPLGYLIFNVPMKADVIQTGVYSTSTKGYAFNCLFYPNYATPSENTTFETGTANIKYEGTTYTVDIIAKTTTGLTITLHYQGAIKVAK